EAPSPGGNANGRKGPAAAPAVPPTRLGPPAAPAKAAAQTPATAQGTLPISAQLHQDYGRLVFNWPSKVGFHVEHRGQTVTIRFDAQAVVDLAALQRDLPQQISAATARATPEGLEVGLVVAPEAQLRYFHHNAS